MSNATPAPMGDTPNPNTEPSEAQIEEAFEALISQHNRLHQPVSPIDPAPEETAPDSKAAEDGPSDKNAQAWLDGLEAGLEKHLGPSHPLPPSGDASKGEASKVPAPTRETLEKALERLEVLGQQGDNWSPEDLATLMALPLHNAPGLSDLLETNPLEAHWHSIHYQLQDMEWLEAKNEWVRNFPQLAPFTQKVIDHLQRRMDSEPQYALKLAARPLKNYAIFEAIRDLDLLSKIRGTQAFVSQATGAMERPSGASTGHGPPADATAGKHRTASVKPPSLSETAERFRAMPQEQFNRLSDWELDRFLRNTIRD